jgi:hypothetical protein
VPLCRSVAASSSVSDRLQLKLTAATGVDELHIDVFPGHDLYFVIRNALLVLGGSEFLDLTIVPELVWLRCANRVRFDRVRRPIHDVYFDFILRATISPIFKRHKRRVEPENQAASTQGSEQSNDASNRLTHGIVGSLKPVGIRS